MTESTHQADHQTDHQADHSDLPDVPEAGQLGGTSTVTVEVPPPWPASGTSGRSPWSTCWDSVMS